MADYTTLRNDPNYLQLRLNLGRTLESDKPRIYLDIYGVPTIGIGVALLTKDDATGKWIVRDDRLSQIENLTGATFTAAELAKLDKIADVLYEKGRAFYPDGVKKTPDSFLETPTGKLIGDIIGFETDANGKLIWTPGDFDNISLSAPQSASLFNNMMDTGYESRVDYLLRQSGIDPTTIDTSSRVAYGMMVYKYWKPDIAKIENLVSAGADERQIYNALTNGAGTYDSRAEKTYRVLMDQPNAVISVQTDGSFILRYGDKSGGVLVKTDGSRTLFDQNGNIPSTDQPVITPKQLDRLDRRIQLHSMLDTGRGDIAAIADMLAEQIVSKSSTMLADGGSESTAAYEAALAAALTRKQLVDAWTNALEGQDVAGAEVDISDKGITVILENDSKIRGY